MIIIDLSFLDLLQFFEIYLLELPLWHEPHQKIFTNEKINESLPPNDTIADITYNPNSVIYI